MNTPHGDSEAKHASDGAYFHVMFIPEIPPASSPSRASPAAPASALTLYSSAAAPLLPRRMGSFRIGMEHAKPSPVLLACF
ncbi:hypothetical protein POX_f08066 [Penicillium oxalicum]|uniref:hypothetical protein n=1 Tax=Penicillium oxalicum TaxID=69781 RepID=UPI0020B6E8FB|nr:hypothetical protein POX_f08066 [Penicillium oxalicum]KAI2787691.1 hypothetical protein POX_f08066 [Penicillium oxalicum]